MSIKKSATLWSDFFQKKENTQKTITQSLAETVLFQGLSQRELTYISSFLYKRQFQSREAIFHEGERGFGMYLILKGRIQIRMERNGQFIPVAELTEGNFFGELSLLYPMSLRSASAIAVEPTEAAGLFKPDLDEIIARKPVLGVKIMTQLARVLGQRLIETTDSMDRERNVVSS